VTTFLTGTLANCTTNALTWRCYPDATYADSTTGSRAVFHWLVHAFPAPGGLAYTLSSTPDPFAPQFDSVSLALLSPGTPDEHLALALPLAKDVVPAAALTPANRAATCSYAAATLRAQLYTRRPADAAANAANASTLASAAFPPWPFAAAVVQEAAGGPGVPSCVDAAGALVTALPAAPSSATCSCRYSNYEL
jgi:hypothetical protein